MIALWIVLGIFALLSAAKASRPGGLSVLFWGFFALYAPFGERAVLRHG